MANVEQLEMSDENVSYNVTVEWVADLVLKANRLVGKYPGLLDTPEQREHTLSFTSTFMLGMAKGERVESEAHDVIYCMSQLRKAISALIAEAGTPLHSDKAHLSYTAFDWLQSAARQQSALAQALSDSSTLRHVCVKGVMVLRAALSDAATYYMDGEGVPIGGSLMETMMGDEMPKLVCRALSTQFLATLFDCTRLAAGARLANRAFGDELAPLTDDVRRCELARADAYMAMRLYKSLELVVAMMMMGVAKRAENAGKRDTWSLSAEGKEVIALRTSIGETLKAYDNSKREPAARAGKSYTAQTPGCVAALQEQAALLAAHINEPNSALYTALVAGLGEAQLFSIPTRLSPLRGITPNSKYTFWEATAAVAELHIPKYPHGNDGRVPSFEAATTMTASMVMTSALEKLEPLVQASGSMRAAMQEASKAWPPSTNFYGRDYAETERKITAKAAREGRDPEGREVGESFGYRLEWMGYLANGAPPRPVSRGGWDDQSRLAASITTLSRVEMLTSEGGRTPLPIPSGNAIHHIHGVGLSVDPGLIEARWKLLGRSPRQSPYYEVGDDRYRQLAAHHIGDPLMRKQLFVERVLERTAPMFKGWSGGVLVAEPYYDFFAEVWKRFNDSLCHESSPWSGKIRRWLEHYEAGTTPPRANGEAKLIHPWRAQHLQQAIARTLLEETYGETTVLALATPESRASTRLFRALLSSVIEAYDYAPWASHLVRRFCTMEEHRAAAKRKREDDNRTILSLVSSVSACLPRSDPSVSPSLARKAGPLVGQA